MSLVGKARSNYRKHNVGFAEAVSAFSNPLARIFPDEGHTPWKNSARSPLDIPRRSTSCRFVLRSRRRAAFASSALAAPRGRNSTIMKNTSQNRLKAKRADGLRPEYHFDYAKAKPKPVCRACPAGIGGVAESPHADRAGALTKRAPCESPNAQAATGFPSRAAGSCAAEVGRSWKPRHKDLREPWCTPAGQGSREAFGRASRDAQPSPDSTRIAVCSMSAQRLNVTYYLPASCCSSEPQASRSYFLELAAAQSAGKRWTLPRKVSA